MEEISNTGIDEFLNEQEQTTIPATGTDDVPPPPGMPEPESHPARESTQPVFTAADDVDEQKKETLQEKKYSKDYKATVVTSLLRSESYLTSQICAMAAGNGNPKLFATPEDDIEQMRIALEPLEDWIVDKCPAALPFFLMYGSIKVKQVQLAYNIGQTNRKNDRAASVPLNNSFKASVEKVMSGAGRERKSYVIYDKDGFYKNDVYGNYVKRDGKNNESLEKPDIKDLPRIVKANSNEAILQAFPQLTLAKIEEMRHEA